MSNIRRLAFVVYVNFAASIDRGCGPSLCANSNRVCEIDPRRCPNRDASMTSVIVARFQGAIATIGKRLLRSNANN
jgi:hypothetical protein